MMNKNLFNYLAKNPLFLQAQKMGSGKSKEEIETIAKNLCAEKGINYDEAWNNFQKQMKGIM